MTSDNSESQIGILNLKSIKIKILASRHLRFNLRFETLLFDSPATIKINILKAITTYVVPK